MQERSPCDVEIFRSLENGSFPAASLLEGVRIDGGSLSPPDNPFEYDGGGQNMPVGVAMLEMFRSAPRGVLICHQFHALDEASLRAYIVSGVGLDATCMFEVC